MWIREESVLVRRLTRFSECQAQALPKKSRGPGKHFAVTRPDYIGVLSRIPFGIVLATVGNPSLLGGKSIVVVSKLMEEGEEKLISSGGPICPMKTDLSAILLAGNTKQFEVGPALFIEAGRVFVVNPMERTVGKVTLSKIVD